MVGAGEGADGIGEVGAGVRITERVEALSEAIESKWYLTFLVSEVTAMRGRGAFRSKTEMEMKMKMEVGMRWRWMDPLDGGPEVRGGAVVVHHGEDLEDEGRLGRRGEEDLLVVWDLPQVA